MRKPTVRTTDVPSPLVPPEAVSATPPRDRMEIIRFRTKEELRQALGIFWEVTSPDIFFTFRKEWPEGACVTNTATVRALQGLGFPFEWLTENVQPQHP